MKNSSAVFVAIVLVALAASAGLGLVPILYLRVQYLEQELEKLSKRPEEIPAPTPLAELLGPVDEESPDHPESRVIKKYQE